MIAMLYLVDLHAVHYSQSLYLLELGELRIRIVAAPALFVAKAVANHLTKNTKKISGFAISCLSAYRWRAKT